MSRKPLRALIIEHSPLDIELLERELSSSFDGHKGLAGTFKEVEALLNEAQWDIILSDHNLPGWTGMQALALVQERKLDIPFILVTGALGEEQAIEYFRRGITDYVLKHRLELLPVAVSRALQETAMRREKEQSEERYRVLFQEIPLPLWLYDVETLRFLAVNKAAIAHYGFSEDEFKAMTIKDIRPAEELPLLLEDLAQQVEERGGIWKHRKKDGSVISVEVAGHRLEFDGLRAGLLLANDVTEKIALENQLHHAQKMEALGRLAGGIAHDSNNLLMVINSYAQLLQSRPSTDEVSARYAAQIVKAGQRATDVSRQLLLFSRKQLVAPAIVDLNHIVNDLATMLRRLIGEAVEMILALAKGPGLVKIDPGNMEQVIMNMVINARDAMPKGGKLTIESKSELLDDQYTRSQAADVPAGLYGCLSLTDTGTGISPEILSRIFEPFFATKGAGKGTGLGLATAYGIVKGGGGAISVVSEVGGGATFNAFLPRVAEVASTAPHAVHT